MDLVRYIVRIDGCNVNQVQTEKGAIKIAKLYLNDHNSENVSVVQMVISGSYISKTQVWPTIGNTYTN